MCISPPWLFWRRRYGALVGDAKYPADAAASEAIQNLLGEATIELKSIGKGIRDRIFAKASATVTQLRLYRWGLPDEGNWLGGLRQKASWKDMWALALKTIMKEKPVAGLRKSITIVGQVLVRACVGEGGFRPSLFLFGGGSLDAHSLRPQFLVRCLSAVFRLR